MPLPLTVSCSSKIQIGFTFLVPAYPGYPGKEAVKWLLLLLSLDYSHRVFGGRYHCTKFDELLLLYAKLAHSFNNMSFALQLGQCLDILLRQVKLSACLEPIHSMYLPMGNCSQFRFHRMH